MPAPRRAAAAAWDFAPAIVVAAVIFVLSSLALRAPQGTPGWSDTVAHVLLYAALGAGVLRGWRRRGWPRPVAGPVAVTVAYGVLDELHQLAVPGRSADPWDLAADAVGALLAVGLHAWLAGAPPGT